MNLDLEKAFKYPFQDKDWKKKFLIGSFFAIGYSFFIIVLNIAQIFSDEEISNFVKSFPEITIIAILLLLLLSMISTIFSYFFNGYYAKNTNQRIFKLNALVLEWKNFGNLFFTGFKNFCAVSIYVVTFFVAFLSMIVLITTISAFLFAINNVLGVIAVILMILGVLVLTVAFSFYLTAAALAFKTDLRFATYFNFTLINTIIKKNFLNFFLYIIIVGALSTFVNFVAGFLILTLVGIILMPVLFYYMYLVIAELSAQFLRDTLELKTIVEQGE